MATKWVYFFGGGKAEGHGGMKDILGGKGAGLAEMTNLGVPVPPGFTMSTGVCNLYYKNRGKLTPDVKKEVGANLARLERAIGKKLGDPKNPLLVSVRSGAKFSMPGMMDTILNLGLNDKTVEGLALRTGNPRFAYDSYRRFLMMFSDVVLDLSKENFEHIFDEKKRERGVAFDVDLTAEDLKELCGKYKALVKERLRKEFPQDPLVQMDLARDAVFRSWNNDRAKYYRKAHGIPDDIGTAVNVQAMVFGNLGNDSATGVGFTRNPSNGTKEFYGEYLINAQGEDVVAGIRTPHHIREMKRELPKVFDQLMRITAKLEKHYKDVQDFEFTVENNRLSMLQTRNGKRTAAAAVKIAVDMEKEKLITKEEALLRLEPQQIDQLLHPVIDPKARVEVIAKGLPASPGAATGAVVFHADKAVEWATEGKDVILVRKETSPDDIHGMDVARGILTAKGGMTSHAAVVARQMGKTCVAGCGTIDVDEATNRFLVGGRVVREGDFISLNGSTGEVILGKVPLIAPKMTGSFGVFMAWADAVRRLKVRANADTPRDAKVARDFGAEGIGLCRTEHMFFGEGKIGPMREMILADTVEQRKAALAKLLPLQRRDFAGIFEVMAGRPVTIRTIDPPLHEFLPHEEKGQREVAQQMGIPYEKVKERVESLHEFNPMLGFRGCRLGVIYPEITEMQARAIFEAAAATKKKKIPVLPEVMIPLVGHVKELRDQERIVRATAEAVMKEQGIKFVYLVGTMIEVPRGAVTADEIATVAEFFSFGTNDLTQMTLGVSRDDAARFLIPYVEREIYAKDPFEAIDREGVGELMRMAVERGRRTRPGIKLGICGEHGGEPSSVEFCHLIGLNYVSCSPFRVPIARLAAARAAILNVPKPATKKPAKKAARQR